MKGERRPDFFIVGAPKAGTTALYTYLGRHPDVYVPSRKELRFFGSDLEIRDRIPLTMDDYLGYFADAGDARRVGTAYVWYLYSRRAAEEIHAFAPNATILVMLRSPADMLYALHAEHLTNGNEDIADFTAALDAEPRRAEGRQIPPHAHLPQGLLYSSVPRYAEQLDRYFDRFGRDRVHVSIFEEFVADPVAGYREVLAFLGLADERDLRATDFEVVNASRQLRSERIRHLLARPPDLPRRIISRTVPAGARRSLHAWAKRANVRAAARPQMPAGTRRRLDELFGPEVRRVEALLGRELTAWRRDGSAETLAEGGQADGP
jgi:hypothetical protein